MVRTQIYITEQEKSALAELGRESGKGQSELIREAIEQYLEKSLSTRRQAILERTAGIWQDRKDLPDFGKIRSEWNRKIKA